MRTHASSTLAEPHAVPAPRVDDDQLLYLSRDEVELACRGIDPVAAVRDALRLHALGQTVVPDEAYLAWRNERGEPVRSLSMPGYLGGPAGAVAGTKIINANPANPAYGLQRASGLTLLFDVGTAHIVCLMEGAYISALRTAAVTALSATLLGNQRLRTLAIIGAGTLARAHVQLLPVHLPDLEQLRVFDLDPRRTNDLLRELAPWCEERGVVAGPAASAEEAIRGADLVVPVTTTTSGYIAHEWLRPGALLVNISLDDPLEEVVLRADRVFVDDWHLVSHDSRRLLGRMIRQGLIDGPSAAPSTGAAKRVDAELGEVVIGRHVGRSNAREVILVNPFGLALEDLAVARAVFEAASERGLGVRLER
jgi:ornithine cyclodeaminase